MRPVLDIIEDFFDQRSKMCPALPETPDPGPKNF
jgi:hypothetical protein